MISQETKAVNYNPFPLPDHIEGVSRLTEARLRRDVTEGKIVDFRHVEGGFEVVRMEAVTQTENKVRV